MDIIDKNIGQAGLYDEVNTDAKQQAVTIPDPKRQGTTDPEISQPQWQAPRGPPMCLFTGRFWSICTTNVSIDRTDCLCIELVCLFIEQRGTSLALGPSSSSCASSSPPPEASSH